MAGFHGSSQLHNGDVFPDDALLYFGNSNDVALGYDTVDANANIFKFSLGAGGATHVPVVAIGVGINDVDLGANSIDFSSVTQSTLAIIDADRDTALVLDYSADDAARLRTIGTTRDLTIAPTGQVIIPDDTVFNLGTTQDIALALQSTSLAANTALTDVLVGTPVSAATAANSFILSNITVNADIALFTLLGGVNSAEIVRVDTSAGLVVWNEPGLSDLDHRWEGTGNANLLMLDWGLATVGIGTAAASTIILNVSGNTVQLGVSLVSVTKAAGATQTRLLVENSTNDATQADAVLEARVGGNTTPGDPMLLLRVPDVETWYVGLDNSAGESFKIGRGTAVGSTLALTISPSLASATIFTMQVSGTTSIPSAASAWSRILQVTGPTMNYTGVTTVTGLVDILFISAATLAGDTATLTVNKAASFTLTTITQGANVSLTHSSGIRVTTGGAAVNVSGEYLEAQTAGTTGNYQLLFATGGGAAPALTDLVGVYVLDTAAGDARLYVQSEAGAAVLLGNDRVRFAAATAYLGIGATDVLTLAAAAVSVVGGGAVKSASATEIGIQVTNGALTVGSLGSLVIPVKTDTGAPNDAAAGNLDGAFAYNSFDNTLEIRDGADTYLSVGVAGYVIQRRVPLLMDKGAWYHPLQYRDKVFADETRCVVCGEEMQSGEQITLWANGRVRNNDLHAIFGHLHPERDSYVKQLEARIAELERAVCH